MNVAAFIEEVPGRRWTSHELMERETNMLRRILTVFALAAGVNVSAAAQEPSEQFFVSAYGGGSAPAVASGPEGNFVVVWSTQGGIVGQRFDRFGIRRGDEFVVSASGGRPDVTVTSSGGFVVVWADRDGASRNNFARRYDAAGTPLDASGFGISAPTSNNMFGPDVAADSAGNFVVVWTDLDQDAMLARRFSAAGQALGSEFRVNTDTAAGALSGTVAMHADGDFVVVWGNGGGTAVFARRFDNSGNPLGDHFRVTDSSGLHFQPDVAADASGNFVVVWSYSDVFGQRFDRFGNRIGAEFLVNTNTIHWQNGASVAMAPEGEFVVAWMTEWVYEDDLDIRAQRFRADGLMTGGEIHVSRRTGLEVYPRVAARSAEKSVFVWTNRNDWGDLNTGAVGMRHGDHVFFSDGFETGDTSRWSFSASDGGDLAVTGAAGMKGSASGLQAFVDDTKGLYVHDDTPSDELSYRARFYFNPGDFDPGEAAGAHRTRIFIAFEEDPTRRLLALVLRRIGGQYGLGARVSRDDDSRFKTPFFDISPAPHFVEVRWVRATAPGADDGIFELRIDQVLKASISTLDSSRSAIDFVRMGALSVKAGASGTLYFDEFASRQELLIGP